jgi:L-threonylcarbamoyladenylate synthase
MTTQIDTDIAKAIAFLEAGELVSVPTETVYGLAANALNPTAVVKIFEAKNRPQFNPLIVHCGSLEQMERYVLAFPPLAKKLIQHFMPGPLTLLLPKKDIIPDLVTAGSDKVAIRIPNHPLTLELLQKIDFPLAAPSANPSGYVSPTTSAHVFAQLQGKIPYILEGGASNVGIESTIVGWNEKNEPVIYRLGGLSHEEIEDVCNRKLLILTHAESKPKTAGQLLSHYAPRTPLLLGNIPIFLEEYGTEKVGILSFQKRYKQIPPENQYILSPKGDFSEAAQNLFDAMRHLDGLGLRAIFAEEVPEQGLGLAINDRLRRARYENKLLEE